MYLKLTAATLLFGVSTFATAVPTHDKFIAIVRPACPVRLGGIFTMGLGASDNPFTNTAQKGETISKDNMRWIENNCDVIGLTPAVLKPDDYSIIRQKAPNFTPLLYLYASCLYQSPYPGSVGGWDSNMAACTLRHANGKEVHYPDPGGHWMAFGSKRWAIHWIKAANQLASTYNAAGVIASELPVNNTFVSDVPKADQSFAARVAATTRWLQAAAPLRKTMLIPAALNFDRPVGHPTLPPPVADSQPNLQGTLWDEEYPLMDGGWDEGWICPYWKGKPVDDEQWNEQEEALDRYGRDGEVFIAAAAYHNLHELEYALASYLLVVHHQGRAVFQPMPLIPGVRSDAGYSIQTLRQQVKKYPGYFNVTLGWPYQVRHLVPDGDASVWSRRFGGGTVYVNSTNTHTIKVVLGSPMRRLSGKLTSEVVLPPHSGAVLLTVQ